MTSDLTGLARADEFDFDASAQLSQTERIIEFYEAAGMDYEHWSTGFNMHLGYYRRGLDPFDREQMLEQMNLEVAARLQLDSKEKMFLVDLGCGFGAIARSVAKSYSNVVIKGVTNVPSQVKTAERLNALANLRERIEIFKGDYTALPFKDGTADGVWAVESACYAKGSAKTDLVSEMARVLKTGGCFAVADCFIKKPEKELNFLIKRCYSAVCKSWALPEMPVMDNFVTALRRQGFRDIIVEDISWSVAPSLAHAPFAVLTFILKKFVAGESFNRHSINNLKASLLALALGAYRSKFCYCIISGTRH